jgi:hypothetical protein
MQLKNAKSKKHWIIMHCMSQNFVDMKYKVKLIKLMYFLHSLFQHIDHSDIKNI